MTFLSYYFFCVDRVEVDDENGVVL
jgi:hypothetical protein